MQNNLSKNDNVSRATLILYRQICRVPGYSKSKTTCQRIIICPGNPNLESESMAPSGTIYVWFASTCHSPARLLGNKFEVSIVTRSRNWKVNPNLKSASV